MSDTVIHSNAGQVIVSSGETLQISAGTVDGLTVQGGGSALNYAAVQNVILESGGYFENDNGTVSTLSAQSGSKLSVVGGTVQDLTLDNCALATATDKATLTNVTINSSGHLNVSDSAVASLVTVNGPASTEDQAVAFEVDSAGSAYGVTVTHETMVISSGGYASGVTLNDAGMTVLGAVDNLDINSQGNYAVYVDGGIVSGVTVHNGAAIAEYDGGIVSGAIIMSGGTEEVLGDPYKPGYVGSSIGSIISGGGLQLVDGKDGAVSTSATVLSGGNLEAVDGTVSAATISSGGILTVAGADYTLSGMVFQSGAGVTVSAGGVVSGMTIADGITLSAVAGASVSTLSAQSGAHLSAMGGTVQDLTLDNCASATATDKATLTNVTINSSGYLNVADSAVASLVTVNGPASTEDQAVAFEVDSAGSAYGVTVTHERMVISSGGYASGVTLNDAGMTVLGAVDNLDINSQGNYAVYVDGGVVSGATIHNGAGIAEYDGGLVSGAIIMNGGIEEVLGDPNKPGYVGSSIGSIISGGGLQLVDGKDGAVSTSATVLSGGNLEVVDGTVSAATISSGGILTVAGANYTLSGMAFQSGAGVTVSAGGVVSGMTIADGITLSAVSGASVSTTLASGAQAFVDDGVAGGITLAGDANAALTILGSASPEIVISGFIGTTEDSSDRITLANIKAADITAVTYPDADHVQFTLQDGSSFSLNIIDVGTFGYNLGANSDGDLVYEVCFLAGSMIQTPTGDVPVEDICIGDAVIAYANGVKESRNVIWAGKAHTTVRPELRDDEAGYPVRILKDAIADGVPYKDMLITAEHCLFFEGRFVPVRMLVNGASVFYDKSITSYDYYHVETEQHSVLRADGMLTESYLDTGNRSSFRQEGRVVTLGGKVRTWEEDAGTPLCVDRSFVEPLFRMLEQRKSHVAGARISTKAVQWTDDPDLHLITESGAVIRPIRRVANSYSFMLPCGMRSVRIVSRASRPADVIGPFVDDRRDMGVEVADIHLFCNRTLSEIMVHRQAEKLAGWHHDASMQCVWTNGDAELPLGDSLADGKMGILSMTVLAAGPYEVTHQNGTGMRAAMA